MIKVRVPATSANMGPGFDSLGIALSLYNEFGFEEIENGLCFEGVPEEFCNEENIVYKAMQLCFNRAGYKPKGIKIKALKQDVPVSRGLGSSSSCIVLGLFGANEIIGKKFNKNELFEMAVEIEGHPDNVAPAIFGGMVVSVLDEGKLFYDRVCIKKEMKFIPIIPDFRLSTSDARDVLPKMISMKDGVYNVSRAALMITALTNGNTELLKYACKDSFHQNYRSSLIKGFNSVMEESYKLGAYASYLSGAGPTIMAIADDSDELFVYKMGEFLNSQNLNFEVLELSIDNRGAILI